MELDDSFKDLFLRDRLSFQISQFVLLNNYYRSLPIAKHKFDIIGAYMVVAIIKGRLFLEAMGIAYSAKDDCLIRKTTKTRTDISADDLYGEMIDIANLIDRDIHLFKLIFHLANKFVAHFTFPEDKPFNFSSLLDAVDRIVELINKHFYSTTNYKQYRWKKDENGIWKRGSPYEVQAIYRYGQF